MSWGLPFCWPAIRAVRYRQRLWGAAKVTETCFFPDFCAARIAEMKSCSLIFTPSQGLARGASYRLARVGGYDLCHRRRELIVRNFGSSNCLAKPIRCVRVRTVRRHFDAKPVGHRCWRHAPVTQIGHDAVAANRPPHGGLVGCLTAYLAGIKLTQPREQEILGVRPHADLLGGVGVGIVGH